MPDTGHRRRAGITPTTTALLTILTLSALIIAAGSMADADAVRIIAWTALCLAASGLAAVAIRARRSSRAEAGTGESILRDALDHLPHGVLVTGRDGSLVLANRAFRRSHPETAMHAGARVDLGAEDFGAGGERLLEFPDGRQILVVRRVTGSGGTVRVETDVTELRDAQARAHDLQMNLMQAHKMESLGTLAAGIAHEINTPMQFIGDNLRYLREMIDEAAAADRSAGPLPAGFHDEVPQAIDESLAGVRRVGDIVGSMRSFAHPDPQAMEAHDLNELIRVTCTVSRNLWKHAATLDLDLAEPLPPVACKPGEINQVLLNLIANAVDAIEERPEPRHQGRIRIASQSRGDEVAVTVSDDGIGIPPEARDRIFDMFFTTKPAGKGTGQGLAISGAIVATHGGRFEVESSPETGTAIRMLLPRVS